MSKIFKKSKFNNIINTVLKESVNMVENTQEIKITNEEIDELNDVGHCMCGDKCLLYPEAVLRDGKKSLEVVKLATEKGDDCVVLEKDHMDMLEKEGKCECNGVTIVKDGEIEEGNKFTGELNKAKKEDRPTFTVDGKTYKVESIDGDIDDVEESINDLTESLKNNNKFLNENNMDLFNKIINYNK